MHIPCKIQVHMNCHPLNEEYFDEAVSDRLANWAAPSEAALEASSRCMMPNKIVGGEFGDAVALSVHIIYLTKISPFVVRLTVIFP